jgi:tetratricopeptide (TPR) repeat protein
LEAEHSNLRVALDWSLGQGATVERALRFANALARFWHVRGYWSEGSHWLEATLMWVSEHGTMSAQLQTLKMRGLSWAGTLAHARGDYATACAHYEESLGLARELGHKASIAIALGKLGTVARVRGDYPAARSYYEESLILARELGHKASIGIVLGNLGTVARAQGDDLTARSYYEESLRLARELGHKAGIAITLGNLGTVARGQGDYATARANYEESLMLARELGHKASIAIALVNLGTVASDQGDDAAARGYYEESLMLARELRHKVTIADCLEGMAELAARQGQAERAARLRGMVRALREGITPPVLPGSTAPDERPDLAGQAQLDEPAFAAAWKEGQAMILEQAIAYALEADA